MPARASPSGFLSLFNFTQLWFRCCKWYRYMTQYRTVFTWRTCPTFGTQRLIITL